VLKALGTVYTLVIIGRVAASGLEGAITYVYSQVEALRIRLATLAVNATIIVDIKTRVKFVGATRIDLEMVQLIAGGMIPAE
jgi:hypothetical protein